MPDDFGTSVGVRSKETELHLAAARNASEVTMCNFEHLEPDVFRQRRAEMIALADERRLAVALKPSRVRRARARRREPARAGSPIGLKPAPLFR